MIEQKIAGSCNRAKFIQNTQKENSFDDVDLSDVEIDNNEPER